MTIISVATPLFCGRTRLPFRPLRHRFLWRLRAPVGPGEIRRIERWLATARVFLAISFLVAVWMDPGEIRYSPWAYWLLGIYIVHGVVIMLLLRIRHQSTASFRLLVHAADVVWPALISTFTTGQGNPFFLFFVFVLAAAAYRWGLWETVGTAAAAVCLLWGESLIFHTGFLEWADRVLLRRNLPLLQIDVGDFEPKRLFMRSAYLLVMGLLLGYLAEQQKQLRAEKAVIARILGKARVESGLTGTLQEIVGELLTMYGASYALVASQDTSSQHVYVGKVVSQAEASPVLHWLESSPSDHETYLYDCPAETVYVCPAKASSASTVVALDKTGARLRSISPTLLDSLAKQHQFQCVMAVSFSTTFTCYAVCDCGQERWNVRVLLASCMMARCSHSSLWRCKWMCCVVNRSASLEG